MSLISFFNFIISKIVSEILSKKNVQFISKNLILSFIFFSHVNFNHYAYAQEDDLESYLSDDALDTNEDSNNDDFSFSEEENQPTEDSFQNNAPITKSKKETFEDEQITQDVQSLSGPNIKQKNKRVKLIKHPGQKQGLYKISADGKYYYKIEESKRKYGLAVKGGALILNQLENIKTNVKFNDLYGSSEKPAVYVEYYWSFFKNRNVPNFIKKARVKIASGLLVATGKGRFNDPNYVGVPSNENYTFMAFPNALGLHWAFELKENQLIVPYVTGALEYLVGVELQNNNFSRTKFLGQLGAHVGGGLALSLGWLEKSAQFDLDSEFGINQTFLTVELRQNIPIQSDFNFSATFINAGIQFEF